MNVVETPATINSIGDPRNTVNPNQDWANHGDSQGHIIGERHSSPRYFSRDSCAVFPEEFLASAVARMSPAHHIFTVRGKPPRVPYRTTAGQTSHIDVNDVPVNNG